MRQRPCVVDASVGCVLLLSRSAGTFTLSVKTLKGGKTDGKRKVFGKNCSYASGRKEVQRTQRYFFFHEPCRYRRTSAKFFRKEYPAVVQDLAQGPGRRDFC